MSNRERCYTIIDSFTEEQLENVAVLLSSAKSLVGEIAEDAYCLRLYHDYENNPDKGDAVGIEDFASRLGIAL